MQIKIELKNSYGRLAQREPFLIVDEPEPRIVFDTGYELADTIVTFKHSSAERKVRLNDITGGFNLQREFCKAGVLNLNITLLGNGVPVKNWEVEPIVFKELDGGFQGHPEFEQIKKSLQALEERVGVYGNELSGLTDNVNSIKSEIAGIGEIVYDSLD